MEPLTPAKEKSCALIRWESAKPSRRAEFMEAKRLIWICPRVAQVIEKGDNDEKDMRGYYHCFLFGSLRARSDTRLTCPLTSCQP